VRPLVKKADSLKSSTVIFPSNIMDNCSLSNIPIFWDDVLSGNSALVQEDFKSYFVRLSFWGYNLPFVKE
jgi:hypothetical protein